MAFVLKGMFLEPQVSHSTWPRAGAKPDLSDPLVFPSHFRHLLGPFPERQKMMSTRFSLTLFFLIVESFWAYFCLRSRKAFLRWEQHPLQLAKMHCHPQLGKQGMKWTVYHWWLRDPGAGGRCRVLPATWTAGRLCRRSHCFLWAQRESLKVNTVPKRLYTQARKQATFWTKPLASKTKLLAR